jgi:hypothetical protein
MCQPNRRFTDVSVGGVRRWLDGEQLAAGGGSDGIGRMRRWRGRRCAAFYGGASGVVYAGCVGSELYVGLAGCKLREVRVVVAVRGAWDDIRAQSFVFNLQKVCNAP